MAHNSADGRASSARQTSPPRTRRSRRRPRPKPRGTSRRGRQAMPRSQSHPNAIPKPPQSHILGSTLRPQSHSKATPPSGHLCRELCGSREWIGASGPKARCAIGGWSCTESPHALRNRMSDFRIVMRALSSRIRTGCHVPRGPGRGGALRLPFPAAGSKLAHHAQENSADGWPGGGIPCHDAIRRGGPLQRASPSCSRRRQGTRQGAREGQTQGTRGETGPVGPLRDHRRPGDQI